MPEQGPDGQGPGEEQFRIEFNLAEKSITFQGVVNKAVMWNLLSLFKRCDMLRHMVEKEGVFPLRDPRTDQLAMVVDEEWAAKPITLRIDSPGGDLNAGLLICNAMQEIDTPVATEAVGRAASAAALILASGEPGMRTAHADSEILIHQLSTMLGADQSVRAEDWKRRGEWIRGLEERVEAVLANATRDPATGKPRQSAEAIATMMQGGDVAMTAADAMSFGLIDSVVPQHQVGAKPPLRLTPEAKAKAAVVRQQMEQQQQRGGRGGRIVPMPIPGVTMPTGTDSPEGYFSIDPGGHAVA